MFFLGYLEDVLPARHVMNDLVIDPGIREIVEAIVHVESQHPQLDQIENKGKGYMHRYAL